MAFPVSADGRRSTSALGRAVVADALRRVDAARAGAAERDTGWRTGYLAHFRGLIEAGLGSRQAAISVARDGLASLHRRMRVIGRDGEEAGLDALVSAPARGGLAAATVTGTGEAERELSVPYRGERLSGDALARRLEAWVSAGVIEPSCADAVRAVAARPDWLSLPGRTVVVLGAGAEVGPLPVLLSWGVRVIGLDLPRPAIWERVLAEARRSAGTLTVPAAAGDADLAQRAGVDLTGDVPGVADWLAAVEGPLVLGNYVYADGGANVLLASAVDALTVRLAGARGDVALAFLATPTDVFAVPADAVAQSARAYAGRSPVAKARRLAAADPVRRPSAVPRLPARRRPRHLRQPDPAAGTQLRAGQAGPPVARDPRPGVRDDGVDERGPADPDPVGAEEPGAGGGVRRRSPVRGRGVRARHDQDAHGRLACARPVRRRPGAGASLAGRGARGGARRAVAHRLRAAQRAHAGGADGLPRGPERFRLVRRGSRPQPR